MRHGALIPVLSLLSSLLVLASGDVAARPPPVDAPGTIAASFVQRSYAPQRGATLVVRAAPSDFTVQLFRAGSEPRRTRRNDVMLGAAVAAAVRLSASRPGRKMAVRLRLGRWPSGLYFARLSAADGRLGFAPFVLRPRRLGQQRVAVVLPTNTWQAYNFRDDDRDGIGDTWYADARIASVDLTRPFLNRGVPPRYRGYDAGFLRWFARTRKRADFLADDDLERVASGHALARRYDLIVFPGHEEYVTEHVFDIVARYRNLGGNLAFLSANNFFYRVERRRHRLHRTGRWWDLGRRTAPLFGVEYLGWFENRFPNAPYVVTGATAAPWFFRGTGLENGDRFGFYGIEVDHLTIESPKTAMRLATIPNIFGPGRSADMAYHETLAGAKVFAAGALNFGGSADQPIVARLLENLWANLARP